MSGVIRSLQALIVESASSAETAVKIGSVALNAGLDATKGWAQDRSEILQAAAYSRRLNLLERIRQDAQRAQSQGLDPRQVMGLNFNDCITLAVKDLENQRQIKFEPLD